MRPIFIKNATIVNEGTTRKGDLLIEGEEISYIGNPGEKMSPAGATIIEASGKLLLPGIIDDQVHFREPGLTHKGDILSESRAAVAGGITSFMDMPNTVPQTITADLLKEKYLTGTENSLANYSFYMGATNTNLSEIMKADPAEVCGIKVFMGSSTGNMLVDDEQALRDIFKNARMPVAVHCEDETIIKANTAKYKADYGDDIPFSMHPMIRSREACLRSSAFAVRLAKEYNTRLHILHLSTADEMKLFSNEMPLAEKRITAEVCVHHLWFDESAYETKGSLIKWNPAIKTHFDRDALLKAVSDDTIDIVATDHAPHTAEEKAGKYFSCPSGGPLVQHSLVAILELWHNGAISLEKVVEKMCHNPAILFRIRKRGFIREGYKADLCLVDPEKSWTVTKDSLLYKCGWSPFEGITFRSGVFMTIINGTIVYNEGRINEDFRGQRLLFDR
ncbi:MAG: dihydroorotase [Bacteroidales bacterium]|nr:dihydroorotase [Bacteroidales bacterium]